MIGKKSNEYKSIDRAKILSQKTLVLRKDFLGISRQDNGSTYFLLASVLLS